VLLVNGKPVLGIVVEVQLQKDPRKPFTWPVYVVNLRARLSCPTCVLVVTPSESVAAWARTPRVLGPRFLLAYARDATPHQGQFRRELGHEGALSCRIARCGSRSSRRRPLKRRAYPLPQASDAMNLAWHSYLVACALL